MLVYKLSATRTWGYLSQHPHRVVVWPNGKVESFIRVTEDTIRQHSLTMCREMGHKLDEAFLIRRSRTP